MIRNLKVLGLTLVAVFAMSAMVAQAASAGELTSDGKVKLKGVETNPTFTSFGGKTVCASANYDIGGVNETPHGFMTLPGTTFTVTPTYNTPCIEYIGELQAPATITMNGCDFVLHVGALISSRYAVRTDIVCPGSAQIEIHAYTSSAHSSTICTTKIPSQANLIGAFIENIAGGNITLGGPIAGITATKTGVLCGGAGETNTAELDIDATISGENEVHTATAISATGS